MLGWLKKLFARPKGPEVEYTQSSATGETVVPAGPGTSGIPPAAPIEDPVAEERDPNP